MGLAHHSVPLDILRYIFLLFGFAVIGFNFAAFLHIRDLVHHVRSWRVYLVGTTGLITYVCFSIYTAITDNFGLSWRLPMAGISIALIWLSLVMLYIGSRDKEDFKP
jgi:hypothetical protein